MDARFRTKALRGVPLSTILQYIFNEKAHKSIQTVEHYESLSSLYFGAQIAIRLVAMGVAHSPL
jgi:hypothetical protein